MNTPMKLTQGAELLEKVIIGGDLAQLTPAERLQYYSRLCDSLGLNPLSKPFDYIILSGRLTLYASKACAAQLRDKNHVSIGKPDIIFTEDLVTVTVDASTPDGRTDAEIGIVSIIGLKGDAKANAIMKAVTKAKRRVTLSICGLGLLDESEVDSVAGAERVAVDAQTGEVRQNGDVPFGEAIKDQRFLAGFWVWAKGKGLTEKDVHTVLGEHLANVTLSKAEVKAKLEAFVAATTADKAGKEEDAEGAPIFTDA